MDLEENVPGTVTVSWTPSPDEKKDDRLHYMITKRDSVKRTWQTLADRLFNNKYTAINIMPGRQYHFRVYARNDMGLSEPSESPKWEVKVKKGKCKKKKKTRSANNVFVCIWHVCTVKGSASVCYIPDHAEYRMMTKSISRLLKGIH